MDPEIRALADRFIYEQATLKHIATLAGNEGLQRPVPGYAWNVGQLLAHLANSLSAYGEVVERWLAGEEPLTGFEPPEINARTAEEHATTSVPRLHELFGAGLVRLVGALLRVPGERLDDDLGPATARQLLRTPSRHALHHAIPLIDALPEARLDPLVLNWLLYADFDDEASKAWQAKLLADAREYLASHPREDEEDDE